MCGVNGIFSYGAGALPPDRTELLVTREHMRRRGPDGAGEWWSAHRRAVLGHRRLAIIDLDQRAAQPMVSEDGALALVLNGEIYNHRALRIDLEGRGARFRTTSDTEVILHLYAREGRDMVRRLRGMFALALFDVRADRLLLARDLYGIKPLYYAHEAGVLRFASQVKALLAGGAVSRAVSAAGLTGFHLFGHVPEPFTLYEAVRVLPAGSTLCVDGAGVGEIRPFASVASVLAAGFRARPTEDLDAVVRSATLDSVRHHLVSDVDVGLFLSAGVDSGALLGLMRDAGHDRTRALTLAFPEFANTPRDEAPLAGALAARYGARHTIRRVDRREFLADLPAIIEAMDQPSVDGINAWFVAKTAQEMGLKVALCGLGGDELLAGYPSFSDLPRWRRRYGALARTPGAAALFGRALLTLAPGLARRNPKALGLLRYAGDWGGAYLLRRAVLLPFELDGVMDTETARAGLEGLAPLGALRAAMTPDPGSDTGRVAALESVSYMKNQLLRDADWAGMAHGVEIRTPLVDMEVLKALAPHIPRLTPGLGKAALARAPSLSLPLAVLLRTKTGFSVPTRAWTLDAASATPHRLDSRRWAVQVLEAFSTSAR